MKNNHNLFACILLSSCCFISATEASSTHDIQVYGPEQGAQLSGQSNLNQNMNYTLKLGAFKSKQNALQYQARIQQQTKKTVHFVYQPEKNVPYLVFMGPYSDAKTVVTISRSILNLPPVMALPDKNISTTIQTQRIKQPLIMVSGGPGWSSPGKTQTIYLESDSPNTYDNRSKTQTLGMGELLLGFQTRLFTAPIQTQWGVLVSAAGMARMKGDVWQLADSEFNNMNYSYNINQIRTGLRTKWMLDQYAFTEIVKPYITASLAAGFNHAFSFQNSARNSDIVANPNFKDKTVTAFNYSVGIGLQKEINSHTHVGLGYEFFDWGKSGLASAPGQATNAAPFLNHLYVNTVLLNLTYLR
ncbi:MAG: SPOR domain-containing protein [Legionellaceae bacterium]|nr:SPOR domain-containing protein [Legionellaceae bacterium]